MEKTTIVSLESHHPKSFSMIKLSMWSKEDFRMVVEKRDYFVSLMVQLTRYSLPKVTAFTSDIVRKSEPKK